MSVLLERLLSPYMAPAGEDGAASGGGTAVDRGDDFAAATTDDKPDDKSDDKPADPAPADPVGESADPDAADPADPAPADDKAADPKKKDSRIPLARHTEILNKEREARAALEARLAQYERGTQVAEINTDITKMEEAVMTMDTEYANHMAAGEIKEANAVMAKIRATERHINEAKTELRVQASTAQITEMARYDTALGRIESAYNELNQDHDDFDKDKMLEVVEWKIFYERQKNFTPTKALQEAVKKVMSPAETKAQEKAVDVKPNVDPAAVAAARKKADVQKALDATKRTPANMNRSGMDSNKAGGSLTADNVMKMSQEEFKALPDDVLSRMRGDML